MYTAICNFHGLNIVKLTFYRSTVVKFILNRPLSSSLFIHQYWSRLLFMFFHVVKYFYTVRYLVLVSGHPVIKMMMIELIMPLFRQGLK